MNGKALRLLILVSGVLLLPMAAFAGEMIDAEAELRLLGMGKVKKHIPGAEYRFAVFAYEDPAKTGMGGPLAALVANEVLLNSRVYSLGVLHYKGNLSPNQSEELSYFDKVDRLVASQEVSLAVWGLIRSIGSNMVIDTYLQIPSEVSEKKLIWNFTLPRVMGGRILQAHLQPDRIHVQRLVIPLSSRDSFVVAAKQSLELRAEPRIAAAVVGTLPQDGGVYWVAEYQGDWARFVTPSGLTGWIPVKGHCKGECLTFLDAAAFGGELLAYISSYRRSHPKARKGLTAEALAIEEQIQALDLLLTARRSGLNEHLQILQRWVGPNRMTGIDGHTGIDRGSGIPPGGAAFANLYTIGQLFRDLYQEFQRRVDRDPSISRSTELAGEIFDELVIRQERLKELAFDLAEASLYDPQNRDVLHNLAVLFEMAGDSARAQLARRIALEADNLEAR